MLAGAYQLSKSKATRLLTELYGVPLSADQFCATEAAVGQQLRPVLDKLLTAARWQPANVAETSVRRGRWQWVD